VDVLQCASEDFVSLPGSDVDSDGSYNLVDCDNEKHCSASVNEMEMDRDVCELSHMSDGHQVISSEDECASFDCNTDNTLWADLVQFMVSEHLSRDACNRLLSLLRKHGHNDLPKDCRTIKKNSSSCRR